VSKEVDGFHGIHRLCKFTMELGKRFNKVIFHFLNGFAFGIYLERKINVLHTL